MSMSVTQTAIPATADENAEWALRSVVEALHGLRFGTITLTVQDGVVVQVERIEKRRFQTMKGQRGTRNADRGSR